MRSSEKEGRRREKNGAGLNRKSCLSNDVNSVQSSLSCMYFNADSLLNKRNELKLLIDDKKTAVIGVSEVLPKNCKTKTQMAEICIEGYDCFENLSSAKRGVCIYTHMYH